MARDGWLSAALGRHPAAAFAVLGGLATLGLLLAAERWLEAIGVTGSTRLPALLLVAFGGGLGGLRAAATGWAAMDMSAGFYPFMQALSNAHQATATALLAWSLLLLSRETPRATALGLVLGAVLGLSRPFDFVLLGVARALAVVATTPGREVWRRLRPLAALAPVAAYDLWVFGRSPGFSIYTGTDVYLSPPFSELCWAFAPGLILALVALAVARDPASQRRRAPGARAPGRVGRGGEPARGVASGLLRAAVRGRARGADPAAGEPPPEPPPPRLQVALVLTLATTSFALARYAWVSNPDWHVPAERLGVARALRPHCREGRPGAGSPGHRALCQRAERLSSLPVVRGLARILGPGRGDARFLRRLEPRGARRFLDRAGVRFLVLPGGPGAAAESWLGPGGSLRGAGVGRIAGPDPHGLCAEGRRAMGR